MALTIRQGDIFESNAQTLVNTVNCRGVMGKGIALGFKKRYPDMFGDYVQRCDAGQVRLGQPYLYKRNDPPWILNFPTKGHWKEFSRVEDIIRGIAYLEVHYHDWGITSLAVPPLGAGNGGLEWTLVGPTLHRYLSRLDIPVELYAPHGVPKQQLELEFLADEPKQTAPPLGLVSVTSILAKLLQRKFTLPVGRTKFQKLAYFAGEAGIPTGLDYERGSYGPFSKGLRRITSILIHNGLVRERSTPGARLIAMEIGPAYEDARERHERELARWKDAEDRVVDLMSRIATTEQAELAATIMFSVRILKEQDHERPTDGAVLDYVQKWKNRRTSWFADEQVAEAIAALHSLKWIDVTSTPRVQELELSESFD